MRSDVERFRVNMISSIANQGTVRFMIYGGRMNAELFIVFLARLIDGAEKKIFLIVDNLRVHEAARVRDWVSEREDRIELFPLPKYAPELNPDEYLNCDVKANIHDKGLSWPAGADAWRRRFTSERAASGPPLGCWSNTLCPSSSPDIDMRLEAVTRPG
jgi:transposase